MENVRYFVITVGRSGSTLLCSILADAGADFGLPSVNSWDETGGAFEEPGMWSAAKRYYDAHKISPDRPSWPRKWAWDLLRWDGKRQLARSLRKAEFFKAIHIDLTIQPAFKLGYFPQIIVSFRPFSDQIVSMANMFSERTVKCHETDYLRTYRNALLWLQLYGGCVVSYDEITDPNSTLWLQALAKTSRLSPASLGAARLKRLSRQTARAEQMRPSYGEATASLEKTLQAHLGKVIAPSHVALRAWFARHNQGSVSNSPARGGLRLVDPTATDPAPLTWLQNSSGE